MVQTMKDGLTNPNSQGISSRKTCATSSQNGEAAFALNWTYMYNMANDPKESKVVGKVGVVPAPGVDGKSDGLRVNGSMGLGIPPTSTARRRGLEVHHVHDLAGRQNKYAKLSLPIWKSSYDDPAVAKGQEDAGRRRQGRARRMFPRPTTPYYQELSAVLQKASRSAARQVDARGCAAERGQRPAAVCAEFSH